MNRLLLSQWCLQTELGLAKAMEEELTSVIKILLEFRYYNMFDFSI